MSTEAMSDLLRRDLLNEGPPLEWKTTRHCPTCSSTDLNPYSTDTPLEQWCITECRGCGRHLRTDYVDKPAWEDPEWAKAGEQ